MDNEQRLEQENGEPVDVVAAWPVNITLDTSGGRRQEARDGGDEAFSEH